MLQQNMEDQLQPHQRRIPLWLALSLTVAMSALIALAAIELLARLLLPDPLAPLETGRELMLRTSDDPDIRYELIPGMKGRAWDTDVVINSAGFRGPEAQTAKGGHFRIIALGDSIAFGNALPADAPFSNQLQRLLTQDYGERCEVLNFAVGGYDTLQEAALLRRRALAFEPDLVVVAYSLNDIGVASVNQAYLEHLEKYRHSWFYRLRLVRYLDHWLSTWSVENWESQQNDLAAFERKFRGRIDPIGPEERELRALMNSVPERHPSSWYRDAAHVGRLRYAFRWLSDLSKQNRFRVVITIIPWMVWTPSGYPFEKAHQIVALEARRFGFDVIDVLSRFREHAASTLALWGTDPGHPNELGHRILADALRDYVMPILAGRTADAAQPK